MRASHVVGIDLQLGLGVDGRVFGQYQVLVRLLGVGFLRVLTDEDLAVEDRVRLARQNALIELVARAVRFCVIDRGVRIPEGLVVGEDPEQQDLPTLFRDSLRELSSMLAPTAVPTDLP